MSLLVVPSPVSVTIVPAKPMLAQDVDIAYTITWAGQPHAYTLEPFTPVLPETFKLISTHTDAPAAVPTAHGASHVVRHVVVRGQVPGEFTLAPVPVTLHATEGTPDVTHMTPPVQITMTPLHIFGFSPIVLSVLILGSASVCAAVFLALKKRFAKR